MRLPIALMVSMAACGGEEGAVLTVSAPEGPAGAHRLEIVLANADPDTITSIADQRARPDSLEHEAVRYYRQRASGGVVAAVARLDGFTVRIEPNVSESPDEAFIPFLFAYDADDQLVGAGAVRDASGDPAAVAIKDGVTIEYVVDMVALTAADRAAGIGDRQSLRVSCASDRAEWPSGIAWQPGGDGPQLRLLRAVTAEDATASDASARPTDLDCDAHLAPDQDCDDLRPMFHRDQLDVCDGYDSNCDGEGLVTVPCPTAEAQCGGASDRGIYLCDDRTGESVTECAPDPACQCAPGNPGPCTKCILSFQATSDQAQQRPCAPAIGKLHVPQCLEAAPCTIEVVQPAGTWKAFIGATQQGGFGTQLTGVTAGEIWLEVKLATTDEVAAMPAASVGAVFLAITQGTTTAQVGVDLELGTAAADSCMDSQLPGASAYAMACSP